MSDLAPFVSFVVAARNDNYGGNFLDRMQVFVNALLHLWDKHGLNAELVIVEWNPPEDRPRLKDALSWPEYPSIRKIRIIEVPKEIHYHLPNSDRMPMFEYIAKNVGVRRAGGEYVLSTNPDLLYSDQLIEYFAAGKLKESCFYRVDRYDVNAVIPLQIPVEQQLQFCQRHSFRVATVNGTIPINSFSLWRKLKSLALNPRSLIKEVLATFSQDSLHTVASGDFFLMARSHWLTLRGYPELKSQSFIDGYICFMAASLGLHQIILKSPHRIYHQEHDRSEQTNRPLTDYQLYRERGNKMLENHAPEIFNGDDWGLGQEELKEHWIGA